MEKPYLSMGQAGPLGKLDVERVHSNPNDVQMRRFAPQPDGCHPDRRRAQFFEKFPRESQLAPALAEYADMSIRRLALGAKSRRLR